jgi:ribonuclease VapC
MIAADSSALVAIALSEEKSDALMRALLSEDVVVGVPILLETFCVLAGRMARLAEAKGFCDWAQSLKNVLTVDLKPTHLAWSQQAFERYGKGRGSGAGLNILDCMSYAVAKVAGAEMLCTGTDFTKTDLDVHPASRIS